MTEVLLCNAAGDLEKSKKIQDWTSRNAVLLLSFLTEAVITDRKTAAEALLNTSMEKVHNHGAENTPEETDENEEIGSDEDNKKEKNKDEVRERRDGVRNDGWNCS